MLTIEGVKPYGDYGDKGMQVEQMFDFIAPHYDRLNGVLSVGIDRYWRGKATKALRPFAPQHVLDVATGTGDFAISLCRRLQPRRVVGIDLSAEMLRIGRKKVAEEGLEDNIRLRHERCDNLSFADGSFDTVTVAFGIRNFDNLTVCLREMHRVLQPGGRLLVLELSRPVRPPMKQLFMLYAHTVIPWIGSLISRDPSAYSYLIRSIEAFPQGETMSRILKDDVGFAKVDFKRLTGGICTLYLATKAKNRNT